MTPIPELTTPTPEARQLEALSTPVVLRGLVRHWPAVQAADICSYLRGMDQGAEVFATKTRAGAHGVMGYAEGLTDFNFVKAKLPFAEFMGVLEGYRSRGPSAAVPSVAAQCARIRETVPRFVEENRLPMQLPEAVEPNLWLGNALTVPVHHDHPHNLACVVAGHRRFTLFAPEQIGNLYIGPLEYTPSGAPIGVVDPHAPDFERYPRWRTALEAAWVAELGPGDALYIPPLWWHQVQALDMVNLLVNYWWTVAGDAQGQSPVASLLQAIKALNALPAAQRDAWAAVFDHYLVQREQEPAAHIPEARQGVLARRR